MNIELGKVIVDDEVILNKLEMDVVRIEATLGDIEIIENGTYQAKDSGFDGYKKVDVNVNIPQIQSQKEITIKNNGKYLVNPDDRYQGINEVDINVEVPVPVLGTKKITQNGVYNASDDSLDGYSQVEVETSGVDINDYFKNTIVGGQQTIGGRNWSGTVKKIPAFIFQGTDMTGIFINFQGTEIDLTGFDTSNVTNMNSAFYGCINVKTLNLSNFNTSKVESMYGMFEKCRNMIGKLDLSNFDTSNVSTMANMFRDLSLDVTELDISNFDMSKVTNISYMFYGGIHVERLKINNHHNLGKAYKTNENANYFAYTLDISNMARLQHDDIMDVINGLYDIATAGVKTQKLVLGTINLKKLTEDEIAIATNKGWNVS